MAPWTGVSNDERIPADRLTQGPPPMPIPEPERRRSALSPRATAISCRSCWVVPRPALAIESWSRTAGVGPFFWFDGVGCVAGAAPRGTPADFPAVTAAIAVRRRPADRARLPADNDRTGVFRDMLRAPDSPACTTWPWSAPTMKSERDAYVAGERHLAFEGPDRQQPHVLGRHHPHASASWWSCWSASPAREAGIRRRCAQPRESWDGTDPITRF